MIQFEVRNNVQIISLEELSVFEQNLGYILPDDYKDHMLTYNGGML